MSGQATTKSGRVPLRAMTCGCEGQPLSSLSRSLGGQESTWPGSYGSQPSGFLGNLLGYPWGTARPVPSSATLTNHERSKRKSMFTKARHRHRPTPRCCLPTGSPLPELRPRGLVEPGQPTWKHSACLCCRCFADNPRRWAFVLATEGGLFFNIHKHHKKTVSDQFFVTTFSFFLVYFWQQPRWSRGVECVWAQPLLRCRDNLTYSVILFTMF